MDKIATEREQKYYIKRCHNNSDDSGFKKHERVN